ncbi:MAG: DUF4340 domain-containing protein [Desulfobacterales bacterium]|jgi:hypothetical protein
MKAKKEYIILILIIVGLSVYLFMRSSDRTFYELPKIAGLEQDQITKIEISKGGDSIVLNKKDNKWHLEPHGYLADTNTVKDMLNVLGAFTLTTLVSESKDYVRYDLNAEKRITVKAWQQEALKRNFDIGKSASSFRHTFVRIDGDSRVFHARDNFRGKFELTADNLRDKNVLSFKSTDIREIQIAKDKKSLKLVRSQVPVTPQQEKSDNAPQVAVKFEWQSSDGTKGNDPNLNRLLSTLASLNCDKYINDRKKEAFSAPIYAVKLKGSQDYQLDIFAKLQKDDENYPAVSSASDYPFFLSDSQVQQIMKDPSEFLEKKKKAEDKQ